MQAICRYHAVSVQVFQTSISLPLFSKKILLPIYRKNNSRPAILNHHPSTLMVRLSTSCWVPTSPIADIQEGTTFAARGAPLTAINAQTWQPRGFAGALTSVLFPAVLCFMAKSDEDFCDWAGGGGEKGEGRDHAWGCRERSVSFKIQEIRGSITRSVSHS